MNLRLKPIKIRMHIFTDLSTLVGQRIDMYPLTGKFLSGLRGVDENAGCGITPIDQQAQQHAGYFVNPVCLEEVINVSCGDKPPHKLTILTKHTNTDMIHALATPCTSIHALSVTSRRGAPHDRKQ